MESVLTALTTILRDIHPDSYYQMNPKKQLIYPYLTFDYSSNIGEQRNQETASLEIDVFCNGTSPLPAIQLEEKLKDALHMNRTLTDDVGLWFQFNNGQTIPTLVDNLHRRNVTFNLIIEKRRKNYGTT